jgi:hypothetical protein
MQKSAFPVRQGFRSAARTPQAVPDSLLILPKSRRYPAPALGGPLRMVFPFRVLTFVLSVVRTLTSAVWNLSSAIPPWYVDCSPGSGWGVFLDDCQLLQHPDITH